VLVVMAVVAVCAVVIDGATASRAMASTIAGRDVVTGELRQMMEFM
jgi:hypothetical protein